MAPRGRSRKKNTRTDAALEAMKSYGFSEDLILKKLKELLKVYGDENWFFIEENSYRVLLDNILEHVEQEEHRRDDTLAAGSSSGALPLPGLDVEALDIALPASEVLKLAPQTYEALDPALVTHKSDKGDHLRLTGEGTGQKDFNLDQNLRKQQNTNVIETADKSFTFIDCIRNTNFSPPEAIHAAQPMDSIPIHRRRPYYGWISSDDEVKEEDFVELQPAPLPEEFAKLLFSTNVRPRRKTRWDLRPEDM